MDKSMEGTSFIGFLAHPRWQMQRAASSRGHLLVMAGCCWQGPRGGAQRGQGKQKRRDECLKIPEAVCNEAVCKETVNGRAGASQATPRCRGRLMCGERQRLGPTGCMHHADSESITCRRRRRRKAWGELAGRPGCPSASGACTSAQVLSAAGRLSLSAAS